MDTQVMADTEPNQPIEQQPTDTPHLQGLSKKAQKRAAKAARLHELKLERRAREKEAKKRKRRERAQAIANGEIDGQLAPKRRRINTGGDGEKWDARVVIDLGFDELMSDKEINSLTSQLVYTYSANRRARYAFSSLLFTSLNGRTKERLDAINEAGYRRWSNTEWWEQSYEHIWTATCQTNPPSSEADSPRGNQIDPSSSKTNSDTARETIVYLTADSEEELLELKEGDTYIIGGICDHNRYKNLCLNKAKASRIRHARLPIGRYIALATRKVLTVNQVFEILLKWVETRDWEEAFWAVIPKRKFQGAERKDESEAATVLVVIDENDDQEHGAIEPGGLDEDDVQGVDDWTAAGHEDGSDEEQGVKGEASSPVG